MGRTPLLKVDVVLPQWDESAELGIGLEGD